MNENIRKTLDFEEVSKGVYKLSSILGQRTVYQNNSSNITKYNEAEALFCPYQPIQKNALDMFI
jgi:hypothetical protein